MTRTSLCERFVVSLCLAGSVFTMPACHAQDAPAASGDTNTPLRGTPIKRSVSRQAAITETMVITRSKPRDRRDEWIAYRMAKDPWIDKAIAADPTLAAAICAHSGPARLLAKHRHIGAIAEADPYLCRRLTRWKGATWALIKNRWAEKVITRDPQGIYWAIDRNPKVARVLAKHLMFNQMVVENPDLGKFISQHM